MFALIVAAVLSSAAEASPSPYMWGVGGNISTIAYPGQYPATFPGAADDPTSPNGALEKVGGDMGIGPHAVLYLSKSSRLGARALLGMGSGYFSSGLTLEYEAVLGGEGAAFAFAGGGLGFGTLRFANDHEDGAATLKMGTYLFRGQVGGYYRLDQYAIELDLFAMVVIPGQKEWYAPGETVPVTDDLGFGFFPHGGVEATFYWGDFKPPKKKKKK